MVSDSELWLQDTRYSVKRRDVPKQLFRLKRMAADLQVSPRTLHSFVADGNALFSGTQDFALLDPEKVFAWLIEHERHGKRPAKNKPKDVVR